MKKSAYEKLDEIFATGYRQRARIRNLLRSVAKEAYETGSAESDAEIIWADGFRDEETYAVVNKASDHMEKLAIDLILHGSKRKERNK